MRTESPELRCVATEIDCTTVPATARSCSDRLGIVAKVLWPRKTAAHLATLAGCSERAAAYYLAGDREPPPAVVVAVIREIFG